MNALKINYPNGDKRYFLDNTRVSQDKFEHAEQKAIMFGSIDTFYTRVKPTSQGDKVFQYKSLRIAEA